MVLVRENRSDVPYTRFNVARNVSGMTVDSDNGFARIALQFRYQQRSGSHVLRPRIPANLHSRSEGAAMNRKRSARRGYALLMVIVFLVLFLAMLGTAWRQVASVLRVETVRAVQTRRDQGCLLAAIQGIHELEASGTPSSNPWYPVVDGKSYTVTFTQDTRG